MATVAQLHLPAFVSHQSAAVLHGLPVDRRSLQQVHLTRQGSRGTRVRGPVRIHLTADPLDGCLIDGVAVTTMSRTTVDLCRVLSFRDAVAVADAAVRRGADRTAMLGALVDHPRRPGNVKARRALHFADPHSESAGESHSRAVMDEAQLPMPTLQYALTDSSGTMRGDFAWQQQRLLGEFDGEVKYGRLLRPGQQLSDVLAAEKRRENRLRRLGWWVTRWTWNDLARPEEFAAMIRRMLEVAGE
ncbi:hypothetical protein ACQBAU_15910 [Propionibacteriaceae bacterium Y2011]|uniref:hypothetical protein n=1 Tax=Microlunatus sp. Y2014 TaxID=3418488 RepID=UPI003B4F4AD0